MPDAPADAAPPTVRVLTAVEAARSDLEAEMSGTPDLADALAVAAGEPCAYEDVPGWVVRLLAAALTDAEADTRRVTHLRGWLDEAEAIRDRFPGQYGAGRVAAIRRVREELTREAPGA